MPMSTPSAAGRDAVLDARAKALASRPSVAQPAAPAGPAYLVCRVAGADYGLPVALVAEAFPARACARTPGSAEGVLGLFSHDGRTVLALDLAALLGLAGGDAVDVSRHFVLTRGAPRMALQVERADAVVRMSSTEPAPAGREAAESLIAAYGHAPGDGARIALIDGERLRARLALNLSPELAAGV